MSLKEKGSRPIEETVECIEEIARIVKENDLGKIKIRCGDEFIIEVEGKRCPPPPPAMPMPMAMGIGAPAVSGAAAAVAVSAVSEEPAAVSGNVITSPIIGTFYSSPSPEKPAFVKVGDNVKAGDVVCIIESMKMMNEITSEFSGRVAEIYVNNQDPVEFGQKIMRIE